ncbi:hypothetical protein [Streptomyces sp. NBC_00059]|uniref:hypothetical protein n=1 Tax=Streptomyces sp. NBC_00059 TaxID=2975635 RepID=UPI0022534AED|nr:hypothetical protein [Streptomyces sp. NBC_00059]MCX5416158.1 hypothetical protein [Streptomyces sp. NBC_00059]
MEGSEPTEDEAFAAWCAQLPAISEEAEEAGASARLERDVARVRAGGSALAAYRKWRGTEGIPVWRSWSEPVGAGLAGLPGPSPVRPAGTGAYRCPLTRCDRRAPRDEQGHLPTCAAFGIPMTPVR